VIRRALIVGLLLAAHCASAYATETLVCTSAEGGPQVSMLMGMNDVVSIVSASIEHGGKTWATDAAGAMKIIVGQAFESETQLIVDFTDEAVSTKVAELRLVKASEEGMFATGGTIRLPGAGVWAVSCSF
jgi:hypothetical protein